MRISLMWAIEDGLERGRRGYTFVDVEVVGWEDVDGGLEVALVDLVLF
jgi:hypothetical protein